MVESGEAAVQRRDERTCATATLRSEFCTGPMRRFVSIVESESRETAAILSVLLRVRSTYAQIGRDPRPQKFPVPLACR